MSGEGFPCPFCPGCKLIFAKKTTLKVALLGIFQQLLMALADTKNPISFMETVHPTRAFLHLFSALVWQTMDPI